MISRSFQHFTIFYNEYESSVKKIFKANDKEPNISLLNKPLVSEDLV